jgi:type IV pilus assembly protein PilQ
MVLTLPVYSQTKITAEFYGAKLGTVIDALSKLENKNVIWDSDALPYKDKQVYISIRQPVPIDEIFYTILKEYNLIYVKNKNIINIKVSSEKILNIPPDIITYLGKDTFNSIGNFLAANLTPSGKIKYYPESYSFYIRDTKENVDTLEKLFNSYIQPLKEQAENLKKQEQEKKQKLATKQKILDQLVKKEIQSSPDKFKEIEDKLIEILSPFGRYEYNPKTQKLIIFETRDNFSKISSLLAKLEKVKVITKCFYVRSLEPTELLSNIKENYLSKYGTYTFRSKEMQTVSGASKNQQNLQATGGNTTLTGGTGLNLGNNIITSLPQICITDTPEVIEKIKNDYSGILLNRPYQIVIEARIVQIQSNYIQNLGIQWGGSYSTSSAGTTYSVGSGFTGSNYIFDFPADGVAAGNGAAIGFSLLGLKGRLDLTLSALEQIGKTQILSRPKVITIDGEPAEISQGVEIPYQTSSAQLGTNIQFKQALLRLNVIPRTLPDGNIVMNITLTQDIPDYGRAILGQPPINTKSITSRVVAKDGSTIVIGGILEKTNSTTTTGAPGIQRIPLLGWLFKKRSITNDNRELLIFISPKIVYE